MPPAMAVALQEAMGQRGSQCRAKPQRNGLVTAATARVQQDPAVLAKLDGTAQALEVSRLEPGAIEKAVRSAEEAVELQRIDVRDHDGWRAFTLFWRGFT